jgi:hypothetical protein
MNILHSHLEKISKKSSRGKRKSTNSGYDDMIQYYTNKYNSDLESYNKKICDIITKHEDDLLLNKKICSKTWMNSFELNKWVVKDIKHEFHIFGYNIDLNPLLECDEDGYPFYYLEVSISMI